MTQLIAQLKQFAINDFVTQSPMQIMVRVSIAFTVGLIVATMLF